jgi:hypothetical protein
MKLYRVSAPAARNIAFSLATFRRKIRDAERWGRIGASVIFCKPERISVDGVARN